MQPLDWMTAAVFSLWFGASVVNQFSTDRLSAFKRLDALNVLPVWTFFAPNPGHSDYHAINRDRLKDGSITAWRDALPIPRQGIVSAFWHPRKRRTKVVGDAVGLVVEIVAQAQKQQRPPVSIERALLITEPYLVLVNVVAYGAKHNPSAASFQFAIIERVGFGRDTNPVPVIMSPFHGLE